MAGAMGLSEEEMSGLALKSIGDVSVAVQCALSAESEAIDLLCRGVDMADVANAVLKFIAERVGAMCTCMSLDSEIVMAGGLAKSLVGRLSGLIERDVSLLSLPEYAGAIGAVVSYEG